MQLDRANRSISSEREIENLMVEYAYRNDDADIPGLGDIFINAVFNLDGTVAQGKLEVEAISRVLIKVSAHGISETSHEITNIVINVDECANTAEGRAYWTLYRSISGTPRLPILSGRYLDSFRRQEGRWIFVERHATTRWKYES